MTPCVALAAASLVELDGPSSVLEGDEVLVREGEGEEEVGLVTTPFSSTSSGASKSSSPLLALVHPSAVPS